MSRVPLTRFDRFLYKVHRDDYPMVVNLCVELDQRLGCQQLIDLCNKHWLQFDRLTSIIVDNGKYFEKLPSFDCKTNIEEIIISDAYDCQSSIKCHCINQFANASFDESLPQWYIKLLQFGSNKSYLVIIFHHCIGDGFTSLELVKLLCNLPSKLTHFGSFDSHYSLKKRYMNIGNIWRMMSFTTAATKRLLAFELLSRITNARNNSIYKYLKETLNSIYDSSNDKRRYNVDWIALSYGQIEAQRQKMMQDKTWIKHSFNHFLLAILCETVIQLYKMKSNESQPLPDSISVSTPVNVRPYFDDKCQNMFGNFDGYYMIECPLNPQLTFNQRLKIISKQQKDCNQQKLHLTTFDLIMLESYMPRNILQWLLKYSSARFPLVLSGVKQYNSIKTDWNIAGCKIENIFSSFPKTNNLPVGITYFLLPNGNFGVGINMENRVFGPNGAKMAIEMLKQTLTKYSCMAPQPLVSKL